MCVVCECVINSSSCHALLTLKGGFHFAGVQVMRNTSHASQFSTSSVPLVSVCVISPEIGALPVGHRQCGGLNILE